ncbi:hypothetical protein BH24ACI5_BH24ACI5_23480 [soil metagenome]
MPGFVNLHAHLGDTRKAPEAEYVYKLYLAHGVTTIRGVELARQPFALKSAVLHGAGHVGQRLTEQEVRNWARFT